MNGLTRGRTITLRIPGRGVLLAAQGIDDPTLEQVRDALMGILERRSQ